MQTDCALGCICRGDRVWLVIAIDVDWINKSCGTNLLSVSHVSGGAGFCLLRKATEFASRMCTVHLVSTTLAFILLIVLFQSLVEPFTGARNNNSLLWNSRRVWKGQSMNCVFLGTCVLIFCLCEMAMASYCHRYCKTNYICSLLRF